MRPVALLFLLLLSLTAAAQSPDSVFYDRRGNFEPHAVNPWISLPVSLGAIWLGQRRADAVRDKGQIPLAEIRALSRDDVPGIDRVALDQDLEDRDRALFLSDYAANVAHVSPLVFLLFDKYRSNFVDIASMFLEAQALQGLIYGYSPFGPGSTNRIRPLAYYLEADLEARRGGNERNATFSGHVSMTSTSFYFIAKIIDDYNPQLTGGQRALLYVGATLPSAYGGYLRVRGLKHFPTDVAIGMGVGAFSGIAVPELHRWWRARHPNSVAMALPFYGDGAAGMGFTLRF